VSRPHPPEVRAAAVAAVLGGEALSAVARRMGLSKSRLSIWCAQAEPDIAALDAERSEPERSVVERNVPERSGTPGGVVLPIRRRTIAELAHELVCVSLETLTVQARVAGRVAWIEEQSANGLAQYRGVELDRLLRLLPAFNADAEAPERNDPDEPIAIDLDGAGVGD